MNNPWKTVYGFKKYEMQLTKNSAFIRNIKTKRLVKKSIHAAGYEKVYLSDDSNTIKYRMLHRLIWETFVEKIKPGFTINHKDFNKTNNSIDNLESVTHQDNLLHYFVHGNPNRRKPVLFIKGNVIKKFPSISAGASELKLHNGNAYTAFKNGCLVRGWKVISIEKIKESL